MKDYNTKMQTIPGVTVTDCKSLHDCIHSERTLLSDKRLSLEAAIIRQSLDENLDIRWVSTEQQLADCLTKTLSKKGLWYVNEVMETNQWTLGPDPRVKVKRDMMREKNSEKVDSRKESEEMNKRHSGQIRKARGSATALVATLLACEMGVSNAERVNVDLQEVRVNWLLMVCMTAIILIAILAVWYKYIWKPGLKIIPHRRLLEFEKYTMVAGATWLGTLICFAVEETLLFSQNLQWFHRWHFATTVGPICAVLVVCSMWVWKHLEMLLKREASISNSTVKGIQNEMEAKQDEVIKTINALRQELTSQRRAAHDDIQYLQRTVFGLETLQRNYGGQVQESFYEIRNLILDRTEQIESMMIPLLPRTRREQVVLHAEDESPITSGESTGNESSTDQIVATQNQMADLRRPLAEAVDTNDDDRQRDIANMIEQLEIEVEQQRQMRRMAAR